jgi:hypothetical protein
MADLSHVQTFWQNADAHAAFLHRVTAALVKKALDVRVEDTPDPVTGAWVARQQWAAGVLSGPTGALNKARQMLPALAVKANDAGLLGEDGSITATDQQITGILDDDWVDLFAGYIPEAS